VADLAQWFPGEIIHDGHKNPVCDRFHGLNLDFGGDPGKEPVQRNIVCSRPGPTDAIFSFAPDSSAMAFR
jgi:hypothetical protein